MTTQPTEPATAVKSAFLRSLGVTRKSSKLIAVGILILLLVTFYLIWNGALGLEIALDDGTPVNPYLAAALFYLLIQLILSFIVLALSFPITYLLRIWRWQKTSDRVTPTTEAE